MKTLQTFACAALLASAAGGAFAQQTGTLTAAPIDLTNPEAGSGATAAVGATGPGLTKSGAVSQTYMDIEGTGNGASYETFGVIDFTGDPGVPRVTDSSYNSEIVNVLDPNIALDLFDSPYTYTAPGQLDFYLTEDNAPVSGLKYDPTSMNGLGSQLGGLFFLGSGAYTSTPGSLDGTDYTYDLTLPNQAAQNYVLQQLNTGGNIRILVSADPTGDPDITGSFYGANSAYSPELTFTAAVPEANTPALLLVGLLGLAAMGVARRRKSA